MAVALTFAGAIALAWVMTGVVRRYALAREVLDLPNERSAHIAPTPRGGGLALVGVVSLGVILLQLKGDVPSNITIAIVGGGLVTAAVGWLDDRRGLGAGFRILAHFAAAAWAVVWLGGFPHLTFGTSRLAFGLIGSVFAVIAIVWLINLYNFMDGIDGIAGVNALIAAGFGAFLLYGSGNAGLASIALLIAGASLGFLIWNWSPARIFLGDAGSGALGFYFGVLAVASENSGALPFFAWMILLAVFLVDSTVTLSRRFVRRERWYAAHNNHAYQRAVRAGFSHGAVSISVALIDALVGLAVVAAVRAGNGILLVGAVTLMLLLSIYVGVELLNPMKYADQ